MQVLNGACLAAMRFQELNFLLLDYLFLIDSRTIKAVFVG